MVRQRKQNKKGLGMFVDIPFEEKIERFLLLEDAGFRLNTLMMLIMLRSFLFSAHIS